MFYGNYSLAELHVNELEDTCCKHANANLSVIHVEQKNMQLQRPVEWTEIVNSISQLDSLLVGWQDGHPAGALPGFQFGGINMWLTLPAGFFKADKL